MKKNKLKLSFLFLLLINLIFADVIYFANGDIDEGIVQTNNAKVIIHTKDKTGSYTVPLKSVVSIDYGKWIKNINSEKQKIAAESKKTTDIKTDRLEDSIKNIKYSFPKDISDNIDDTEIKIKKLPNFLLIFITAVFILFLMMSIVSYIIVLIDAFRKSIVWGILSFLLPIVLLIYLFTNYSGNKRKMGFLLFAPVIWLIFCFLIIILTG